jgi:hypothetical protein
MFPWPDMSMPAIAANIAPASAAQRVIGPR